MTGCSNSSMRGRRAGNARRPCCPVDSTSSPLLGVPVQGVRVAQWAGAGGWRRREGVAVPEVDLVELDPRYPGDQVVGHGEAVGGQLLERGVDVVKSTTAFRARSSAPSWSSMPLRYPR